MLETNQKIKKLTPEQEAYMPIFAKKYIEKGLSVEPANKKLAENSITEIYKLIDKKKPKFIWVGSPFSANVVINVLKRLNFKKSSAVDSAVRSAVRSAVDSAVGSAVYSAVDSAVYSAVDSAVNSAVRSAVGSAVYSAVDSAVDSAVRSAVRSAVDSAVGSAVDSAVNSAVYSAVDSAVNSAVRSAVGSAVYSAVYSAVDSAVNSAVDSAVGSAVGSAVYSAVDSAVDSAVRSAVGSAVYSAVDSAVDSADKKLDFNSNYFGGNLWPAWISFYKLFEESKLVKYNEFDSMRLNLFADIVDSCGWWYPFENLCIVCDRPEIINIEDGQLNSENMPAIKFRDGWAIYAINGHLVPEKVIMNPELITLEEIEKEDNSETKRIMIYRYGIGRYLSEIGAKVIDIDSSNTFRSLIVTKDNKKFLEGTDGSTERVYFMPVPGYVNTCKEAHEAICGVDENMFLMQS